MPMFGKGKKIYSILTGACPKCHKENMYVMSTLVCDFQGALRLKLITQMKNAPTPLAKIWLFGNHGFMFSFVIGSISNKNL